ncbi:MAG: glycosyltransferase family 39 protein, partial [Candidatus Hydrogenedentes bacterium]|nr:glycosyltransferase family 39 protein [Candidatus Hydrogenedentota bacterium]
ANFIIPDLEWAAIGVSLGASVLLIWPVFRLSDSMHGRSAARVAALSVCLWPWLVDYGCRVAPEALMSVLWFGALWALAQTVRRGGFWPYAAALWCFGLHLTRPEGMLLWAAAPFVALILRDPNRDARVVRLIPFIVTTVILLGAYALYMRSVTGTAVVSSRAHASALRYVLVDQGAATAKTFLTLFSEVLPIMLGPLLLIFMGAGLFMASDRKRDLRLELMILAFAAAQFVLAGLSTFAEPRYVMNVAIGLTLWSARGVALTSARAAAVSHTSWLRRLPVAALVAMFSFGLAVNIVPPVLGRMSYQPVEYKIAGIWMKEHLEPGLILCRKPQVGFYAGMPSTGPAPNESVAEVIQRARDAGARYLVVDERYTAQMVPSLEALLDPATVPEGLRLMKADLSPYAEARIVIYEVLPE